MVDCSERIWEAGQAQQAGQLPGGDVAPIAPNPYPYTLSANQSSSDIVPVKTASWNADLAIGKVAFASSVLNDDIEQYGPYFAIDGETQTQWRSGSGSTQWIVIDLGRTYSIEKIEIDWGSTSAPGHNLQVSDDNDNWITASLSGENKRFVRVYISSGTRPYQMNAVRVFGTESSVSKW
jgi:hypothetical protein